MVLKRPEPPTRPDSKEGEGGGGGFEIAEKGRKPTGKNDGHERRNRIDRTRGKVVMTLLSSFCIPRFEMNE